MPAKKLVSKETIINASLSILEENGSKAINARDIARYLNCSTQPIYKNFKNMDELKTELKRKCQEKYFEYVKSSKEATLFLKFLASLVFFSYDYPNFFKYLYMDTPYIETPDELAFKEDLLLKITEVGHINKEQASKFYMGGFIVAYGVASQIATGYIKWEKPQIEQILNETFKALKVYVRGDENEYN